VNMQTSVRRGGERPFLDDVADKGDVRMEGDSGVTQPLSQVELNL